MSILGAALAHADSSRCITGKEGERQIAGKQDGRVACQSPARLLDNWPSRRPATLAPHDRVANRPLKARCRVARRGKHMDTRPMRSRFVQMQVAKARPRPSCARVGSTGKDRVFCVGLASTASTRQLVADKAAAHATRSLAPRQAGRSCFALISIENY